ncbi:glycosyltransferase family 4 protein [Candidatus Amarolinea dominans]|uniref:glycosyltransferase family 4 protein n=1 Tax=Candidatus Amarolinea dominans TaxID=3140696 RepID=UPI003135881E|nr:glycosyltransferase family 4 protein [Anaerolineae bacterium]
MTHLVIVNYACAPDLQNPDELLDRYFSLVSWADGLALAGAQVTVVQATALDAQRHRRGVTYLFVNDGLGPHPRAWQIPRRLHGAVTQARPDVVHVNGLLFPLQTWALRQRLPRTCPLVVQHHAERPWTGARGAAQRLALRSCDGFLFTALALAQPWQAAGIIHPTQPVFEIMEGTSDFRTRPRAEARAITGLTGDPVLFWAGNLDANKDPLTILDGFELALAHLPAARLYMAFRFADLLPAVRARIAQRPALRETVELLGNLPRADIEPYYNSADFFVQGSHHESTGYALLDALACGVVPIVTDIPAFRVLTHDGLLGALWPPDDAGAFAASLVSCARRPLALQAAAVTDFFDARLSIPAVGRQALNIYQSLHRRRAGRQPDGAR